MWPIVVELLYTLAYSFVLAVGVSCKYLFVWSCALANCNIDWPTVPNVFSKAVVSNVTWGCCTIIGHTGPGGPSGPGGPCLPGCLGSLPFPGGPPSSGVLHHQGVHHHQGVLYHLGVFLFLDALYLGYFLYLVVFHLYHDNIFSFQSVFIHHVIYYHESHYHSHQDILL